MSNFNIGILALAREARGLTQVELSTLLKVKQGTISQIENGKANISEDIAKKLPSILNFPEQLFYSDKKVIKVEGHYRKKISLPVKELKEYKGKMTFTEWHINKLSDAVDIPKPNIPLWDIEKDGTIEKAANFVREYWKIPRGRINDLATIMENNGIIIAPLDLHNMDALSTFSSEYNLPIIYINRMRSADRIRFNLAHELCHYVCHFGKKIALDNEERDIEKEANTFANELLLPTVDIASHLSNGITIDKLIELKQYWKVSMQAILYKAKSLKFIADNQYNYLVRQMGYLGYRTKEPVDIEPDNISLLKELIDTHIQEMGYTKEGLADLLNINLEELNDVYFGVKPRVKTKLLRVVI